MSARAVVDAVLADLMRRKGVGDELEQVEAEDPETWKELRAELAEVVAVALEDDPPLEELLAQSIERARARRDEADERDRVQLSVFVTRLEEAALWLCEHRARAHLGENALLDWLREV